MEPNSPFLLILLTLLAGLALYVMVRYRHIAVRLTTGLLALVLAAVAGMALVNDYYGYYQTWGQVSTDLNGSYSALPATAVAAVPTWSGRGRLESVNLPGKLSGIDRPGLVYLPPEYFQPAYAHTDFPVLELMHGSPGTPSAWLVHLSLTTMIDRLRAERQIGPMILVMPTMNGTGDRFQDCVNAPGALDDTYITQDVRTDIESQFRASRVAAEWGIAGYSSGGYCTADLALRHPASFGAAGIMDGYFQPQDGPAAKALNYDPSAETANDPLRLAASAGRYGGPIPAFWVSYGDADKSDAVTARAFTAALHGIEAVPEYQVPGAGHNFYAWQPALPYLLQWMWTQVAPPELRVAFPISGPVTSHSVPMSPQMLIAANAANHHRKLNQPPLPPSSAPPGA